MTYDIITQLLQALIGGLLVMWLRNDTVEQTGGFRWTRSVWVTASVLFAGGILAFRFYGELSPAVGLVSWLLSMAIFVFVLTAPHGQTLRGPHQDIPPDEDDPIFETAMFITDQNGGAGDRLGWPTWLIYQFLRYVLPLAMLGTLLGDLYVAVSGILVVAMYWPVGHLAAPRLRTQPQFFGAFFCGALIIGGF